MKTLFMTIATLMLLGTATGTAYNVSGTITCDGRGVAGVAVSDGYEIVLTDADGYYAMSSSKLNGYVFYTLPRGYEPMLADGFNPQFWARLNSSDITVDETHDFTLRRVENDRYTVLFAADTHLARRCSDRAYFKKGFIASFNDEVQRAGGDPIHSVLLGDLTWDVFWTQNDYNLSDFMADMEHFNYPMPLWPVIGNHDHDPSVPAGENTDEEAAVAWRKIVCPNYYSFNLGKVHYVVLDDILYLNIPYEGETYSEGVVGSRNYRGTITAEQMQWLRKDLALVNYDMPVVVCLHIPAWSINDDFTCSPRLDNTYTLCSILNKYKEAHIVSGHNHGNYTVRPVGYNQLTEHNIAATCGSLWQSAIYTGHHICHDGSPAGYMRLSVSGDDLQWTFKPIHEGERQMRLYDMNSVRDYYRNNAIMRGILQRYPSRVDYGTLGDNVLMVNVFSYAPGWQVTICEGDNVLPCERVCTEDPFHTLAYDAACFSIYGNYSTYYITSMNTHMFKAQATTATEPVVVRVVDNSGNIWLQTIDRPHKYGIDMEASERTLAAGDVNRDGEINVADVNMVIDLLLKSSATYCLILADTNADGEVNIADINTIIDKILNS